MATLVISRPSLEAALCNIRKWHQTKPGIGIFLEFFNMKLDIILRFPSLKRDGDLKSFSFHMLKLKIAPL